VSYSLRIDDVDIPGVPGMKQFDLQLQYESAPCGYFYAAVIDLKAGGKALLEGLPTYDSGMALAMSKVLTRNGTYRSDWAKLARIAEGPLVYMWNMYVDPSHRGQGLGFQMLDTAIVKTQQARGLVVAELTQYNQRGQHAGKVGKKLIKYGAAAGFQRKGSYMYLDPTAGRPGASAFLERYRKS